MITQNLNGIWKYRIGKGTWKEKSVPFSALAVGHSECARGFDLEHSAELVFLKLDGITYEATVTLNGKIIGKLLPYCEYTIDITDTVKERDNQLLVELENINVSFGPSEGWENYGGIIRDVSLVYRNSAYIEDVFFTSKLENNYKDASYSLDITAPKAKSVRVRLLFDGATADEYTLDPNGEKITRKIKNIHTWSPEMPSLYQLIVELLDGDGVVDKYECSVGFRAFECERHRFLLNGAPVFLKGVCKHEMYGDSGHTVTESQIESDLKMIKEMGCNFVRLVHYPHNKKTLEIADRLGLMVCEEPGLWQSDTSNPALASACLEVLKRTVLRDRNHACVVFWLCFNECDFNEQFLKDAVRVCRENDGTRLVSGANNMSDEETLKYYNLCGLDFYTTHPYYDTFDKARESARVLNDKPLMFTEWGGYYVYDNPHLLKDFIKNMHALYEANSDDGALAGECLWYFAEINDFDRGGVACLDGTLKEALVTIDRKPTLIYYAFCEALREIASEQKYEDKYEYIALDRLEGGVALRCESAPSRDEIIRICKNPPYTRLAKTRKRQITAGPILLCDEVDGISRIPYLVPSEGALTFSAGVKTEKLTLLGLTSISRGYPVFGAYGEVGATLIIEYSDSSRDERELKNGIDFSIAYTCLGSSRIDPVCEKATRFAKFNYDKNFENYIINRLDINVKAQKEIKRVILNGKNGYDILIYGIFK